MARTSEIQSLRKAHNVTLSRKLTTGSQWHYARTFDWRGIELTRKVFQEGKMQQHADFYFRESRMASCIKPINRFVETVECGKQARPMVKC